jgi:glutamine amidotransferase
MIAVVDYDAGNLRSVETALQHLGARFRITSTPSEVTDAERVIVPGVGDARAAMERLSSSGLDQAITSVAQSGRPVMGICLGSQIVLDFSEENDTSCLHLIPGTARAFPREPGRKVPHMGWNTIEQRVPHPLFDGIRAQSSFYFVHSYYPAPTESDDIMAWCDYGTRFAAVVGRKNVIATQFHPEKSGKPGLTMLANFLNWEG